MSNHEQDTEYDVEEIFEAEISDDDYGFVIGPDGELKCIFTPTDPPFQTPENVVKILQIFGIADPDQIEGTHSIH